MGLRFRRSFRVLPAVRLNIGLKSTSISVGRRGLLYTIGTKGRRVTAGIPGTGLSWTECTPHKSRPAQATLRRWLIVILIIILAITMFAIWTAAML